MMTREEIAEILAREARGLTNEGLSLALRFAAMPLPALRAMQRQAEHLCPECGERAKTRSSKRLDGHRVRHLRCKACGWRGKAVVPIVPAQRSRRGIA